MFMYIYIYTHTHIHKPWSVIYGLFDHLCVFVCVCILCLFVCLFKVVNIPKMQKFEAVSENLYIAKIGRRPR